jgi:hypothetical protein
MPDSTLPRLALPPHALVLALGLFFGALPFAHAEEADAAADAVGVPPALLEADGSDPAQKSEEPETIAPAQPFGTILFSAAGTGGDELLAGIGESADAAAPEIDLGNGVRLAWGITIQSEKKAADEEGDPPALLEADGSDPALEPEEPETIAPAQPFGTILFSAAGTGDDELLAGIGESADAAAPEIDLGNGLRLTWGITIQSEKNAAGEEGDDDGDYDDDESGNDDEPVYPYPQYSATRRLIEEGLSYIGIRYRMGGSARETGFDCSGLVLSAFRNALGFDLPHSSRSLASRGARVGLKDLRPGDLVFFNITRRAISHVGIYIGEGRFLHSPSTGRKVRIDDLSSRYWASRYATARRMLDEDPFDVPSRFEPFVGPPAPVAIR